MCSLEELTPGRPSQGMEHGTHLSEVVLHQIQPQCGSTEQHQAPGKNHTRVQGHSSLGKNSTSSAWKTQTWQPSLGLEHSLQWMRHPCIRGWASTEPLRNAGTQQFGKSKNWIGNNPFLVPGWKAGSKTSVCFAQVLSTGSVTALCSTTHLLVPAEGSWALSQTSAHIQSWYLYPFSTRRVNWYWTHTFCCCNKTKVKEPGAVETTVLS